MSQAATAAARIGLCADCKFARVIESARGSTFWRCSLSEDPESGFPKYPRLPVRVCTGYQPMLLHQHP
jgi:hypothetical protein